MALSWNEIKSRATAFSKEWQDSAHEDSQAKPFLIGFFEVFGITISVSPLSSMQLKSMAAMGAIVQMAQ